MILEEVSVGGHELETLALGLPFMAGFLLPGNSGWGEKVSNALENYDHLAGMWVVGELHYATRKKCSDPKY